MESLLKVPSGYAVNLFTFEKKPKKQSDFLQNSDNVASMEFLKSGYFGLDWSHIVNHDDWKADIIMREFRFYSALFSEVEGFIQEPFNF